MDGGVWEARRGDVVFEVFEPFGDDSARYSWFAVDYATGHTIASGVATRLSAAQAAVEAAAEVATR